LIGISQQAGQLFQDRSTSGSGRNLSRNETLLRTLADMARIQWARSPVSATASTANAMDLRH